MKNQGNTAAVVLFLVTLIACGFWSSPALCKGACIEEAAPGIGAVPASMEPGYKRAFCKYTKVVAPNGNPIHIFAQDKITDLQMLRAKGVLEHYLTDCPGSLYGEDKSAVANRMADNGAALLLLNGSDDRWFPVRVEGQPLYQDEIQVEGGEWYMNQDYEHHRDATFEEILHLVHDFGIGVDGPHSLPGALPGLQARIRVAQQHALANGLMGDLPEEVVDEWTRENSLSQEYLAAVVDSWYGLWGAWPWNDRGMYGQYCAKDRNGLRQNDPMGAAMMDNTFFHPYLTYNARIDPGFEGTFSLRFDPELPYTHHARYLKDVTLTGDRSSNVRVNGYNNDITGNSGKNTVLFSGNYAEYTIRLRSGFSIRVEDGVSNRDGINTLRDIEVLTFQDRVLVLGSET
ncbi:hypothetical protein [Desulfoluna spongiiphila]|uniref:Uncharacterized protein n=1 Tax=Desulfoluna spongiiphila TaxID=419481 RepID=A0A1G5AQJ2_9BACT|nr:hypothetical protein [Desulfoluna spongiiphila]SCX80154.1 hypothetical protein SAMN05216233_101380 [Desulfoluna spongiiphila]